MSSVGSCQECVGARAALGKASHTNPDITQCAGAWLCLLPLLCCAAVSQRNIAEHFPHLAAERGALLEALLEFAEEHLERFPEPDVAADVYITASGWARTFCDSCLTCNLF
jgi:hypothetical protein